jgi:hypothetical protein
LSKSVKSGRTAGYQYILQAIVRKSVVRTQLFSVQLSAWKLLERQLPRSSVQLKVSCTAVEKVSCTAGTAVEKVSCTAIEKVSFPFW